VGGGSGGVSAASGGVVSNGVVPSSAGSMGVLASAGTQALGTAGPVYSSAGVLSSADGVHAAAVAAAAAVTTVAGASNGASGPHLLPPLTAAAYSGVSGLSAVADGSSSGYGGAGNSGSGVYQLPKRAQAAAVATGAPSMLLGSPMASAPTLSRVSSFASLPRVASHLAIHGSTGGLGGGTAGASAGVAQAPTLPAVPAALSRDSVVAALRLPPQSRDHGDAADGGSTSSPR
jgi:hypothetical protein